MSDKTIRTIRAPRSKDRPYFSLSRAVAQDETLSWEARGMLVYLLSKPDDWEVRPANLQQLCGRDKVYRILKELLSAGYLVYEHIRRDDGVFSEGEYRVYETPQPKENGKTDSPHTEKPDTVKPDTEKPDTYILESQQNREEILPDGAKPAAQVEKPKRKPHKFEPWHDALVIAFGIDPTTLTKTADGLYWKVASELATIHFPVERIGELYRFVKQKANREHWGDFTASALAKYAPSYLATLQPKAPAPAQQEWPADWYPRTDDYLPLDAQGNWIGAK